MSAGIPMRVTSALTPEIRLHDGHTHYRAGQALIVGLEGLPDDEQAIRILEILAHGFHLYEAKECVRGLFGVQAGYNRDTKKPPEDELQGVIDRS